MEILNKNTFSDDNVIIEKVDDVTLVYIGKACYSLRDLEKVVAIAKKRDFNESLNYRIRQYIQK